MTHYNSVYVRLSNSQLIHNKLKWGMKSGTKVTLKILHEMWLVILMIKIMMQIRKYLILVDLLRKLIIMQKWLK